MGAEKYEIKELPTNVSSAVAAAVDAGTLAVQGEVLTYDFGLAAVNAGAFAVGVVVGAPKSADGEIKELTDEEANEAIARVKAAEESPEAKSALPQSLLISIGIWALKKLIEKLTK